MRAAQLTGFVGFYLPMEFRGCLVGAAVAAGWFVECPGEGAGERVLGADRRSCSLGDQGELDELIVTVDHDRRRLAYSIRQSPLNFTHHSASWQVRPEGDKSRLVWITDVKPDSVAPALEELIDQTADSIQRNLSRT